MVAPADSSHPPTVTVLMPVYNGGRYLEVAIQSILQQTLKDWEFLIIDDGSTDSTPQILNEYARRDHRFTIVRNSENIGIPQSLNKGISLSSGKYLARMDSDDISLSDRFEKQVDYLERHPFIGICGTWVKTTGSRKNIIIKYPRNHDTIVCAQLFASALAHPSVMMRRDTLEKHGLMYSTQFPYAQDYEFWVRCSNHTRLANLDEVLLILRQHDNKIGEKKKQDQSMAARRVREVQFRELGINPGETEVAVHEKILLEAWEADRDFLINVVSWMQRLITANSRTSRYPEPAFSNTLAAKWFSACSHASRLGLWTLALYVKSPLSCHNPPTPFNILRLAIRCLFRRGYWRSRFIQSANR